MAWIEIDGKEIPLLEPPATDKEIPRRALHVTFKYKRLILTVFLLISLPALIVLFLLPTKYRGASKVFIKPTRAFSNLTPTGYDNTLSLFPSPDVLNSEAQIIKSRELGQQLKRELPFPDKGFLASSDGLDAKPLKDSSIIEISLTSTNPEWTAKAVNRAAELYQEYHLKVHKNQGVEEFYDKQEKKLRGELAQAEAALQEFQQKQNIIDAPQEVNADLGALAAFERSLKETDSAIRETEQRIAVLDDQIKQQKTTITSGTSITPNPVYLQIRTKITQLELERDGLLQRYMPEDRLVKDKEKEIAELKKNLETVKPTSVGGESISLNDVHRRILNELLSARVQLRALNEKKAVVTKQVESYSSAAAEKKRKGFEYDRLLRDVNIKKTNLDLYRQKAEEARISDAMDEQKLGNVYVFERASLPLPAAGRSTMSLCILILLFSAGLSIGFAFAVNYFDPAVQDEMDVEKESNLPVLATIQHYQIEQPKYSVATT